MYMGSDALPSRSRALVLAILLVGTISLLAATSFAQGEPSTLHTLNNQRNVDDLWLNLEDARQKEYDTSSHSLRSSIVTHDIDDDGHFELYYTTDDGKVIQYSTKDDSYRVLFGSIENGRFIHAPQIADVDFDNHLECIVYDVENKLIRCFNLTDEKEKWNIGSPDGMTDQPKIIIDDERQVCQIVLGFGSGEVAVADGAGNIAWRKSFGPSDEPPYIAVADIDYDGDLDIVMTRGTRELTYLLVGIDIIELESGRYILGWNASDEGPISVPPIVYDLIPDEAGMEIIVCSNFEGIRVLSSMTGEVLWHHPVAFEQFRAAEIVEVPGSNLIVASSDTGVLTLNGTDGGVVSTWHIGRGYLQDLPFVGQFDAPRSNKAVFFSSYRYARVMDPVTNLSIWNHWIPEDIRKCRYAFTRSNGSRAVTLHMFFWNYELETTDHIGLWIPYNGSVSIEADPDRVVVHPNIGKRINGIEVRGSTDPPAAIMVKIRGTTDLALISFQGDDARSTIYDTRITIDGISIKSSGTTHVLEFTATVSWALRERDCLDIEVQVLSDDGSLHFRSFKAFIVIERVLVTQGALYATDGSGALYNEGDWVAEDTPLEFGDLYVFFENTTTPPNFGDVQIDLDTGPSMTQTYDLTPSGEVLVATTTPSDLEGRMDYLFRIYPPGSYQEFEVSYHLFIDGTPPIILETFPEDGDWFGEVAVTSGCSATDGDGSGIGRFEVQYGASEADASEWTSVDDIHDFDDRIEGRADLSLDPGTWTFRWRVFDVVGHGPVISEWRTIHVDITSVSFLEFSPTGWLGDNPVLVGVTVMDNNGSGVDLTSIFYAVSTRGLFSFSDWISVDLAGTQNEVRVELELDLEEGVNNYVWFRASDMVGNERLSDAYQVKLDLTPPTFLGPEPLPGTIIDNKGSAVFSIQLTDAWSGVDQDSVMISSRTDDGEFGEWMDARASGPGTLTFTAEVTFTSTDELTVRWKGRDLVGHEVISDVYTYPVNRPPKIILLKPVSPTTVSEGVRVPFEVIVEDPEEDMLTVRWSLGSEVLSNETQFNMTFRPGKAEILLTIDDGHGNVVTSTQVVKTLDDSSFTLSSDFIIPLLIVIALVAIAIIWYIRKQRKNIIS